MIRKIIILILIFVVNWFSQAQQLQQKIGANPTIINPSAALEVESTTQGFLPPRMTNAQMTAIATPATGLMVFCTDCLPVGLQVYDGTAWVAISAGAVSTLVADCNANANGFSGIFMSGFTLSGAIFSTTITNNTFSNATINFSSADLVLSGVSGLTVGTPSPASATINPGASQKIDYPVTGIPSTAGALTGTWNKDNLTCSDIQTVLGLATALNDRNYCTNAAINGMYISGNAFTASNTFSVTITNNSGNTINGLPAPNLSNLSSTWTGAGTISIASVSPVTSINLANGASQTITYTLSGTPTSIGTLTLDWSYGDLSCQKFKSISLGDATFSLPVTASVVSICQGVGCSEFSIQGVVDNAANKKTVGVYYTGGIGSYNAYTSDWIISNSGTGEGGDTNTFRLSYPSGTFSTSGIIPVTIEVDGDGSFNALKMTSNNTQVVATLPFNVNGNHKGSIILRIVTCGAPTNTGGFLVFKCHNLGADETANPFLPNWKLNGAYIQWGKRGPTTNWATAVSDGTLGFAAAPTGPGTSEANSNAVTGWSTSLPALGSWNVNELGPVKTVNDPCPSGYRVPTRNEWVSIYTTSPFNTTANWSKVSSWVSDTTFYNTGKLANNSLYLPAAGYRSFVNGGLQYRGTYGSYASSTTHDTPAMAESAYAFYLSNAAIEPTVQMQKKGGFSVRCVAE